MNSAPFSYFVVPYMCNLTGSKYDVASPPLILKSPMKARHDLLVFRFVLRRDVPAADHEIEDHQRRVGLEQSPLHARHNFGQGQEVERFNLAVEWRRLICFRICPGGDAEVIDISVVIVDDFLGLASSNARPTGSQVGAIRQSFGRNSL